MSDETGNDEKLNLAGVLLAAGASNRLGQPKQLLDYHGVPLVYHVASLALKYCDSGLTVVTGAGHDDVVEALNELPVRVSFNPGWPEGMGSSIRQGATVAGADARAILLMVCDQPSVNAGDLENLVNAWKRRPEDVAASAYGGTTGVPAIFPTSLRTELLGLKGDRGAKTIIDARKSTIVDMPNALFDIDVPDHLDRLQE